MPRQGKAVFRLPTRLFEGNRPGKAGLNSVCYKPAVLPAADTIRGKQVPASFEQIERWQSFARSILFRWPFRPAVASWGEADNLPSEFCSDSFDSITKSLQGDTLPKKP
jgi:hypothetical protein